MIIRAIEEKDLFKVREIHENFFKEEFSLPDFRNKFFCAFAVEAGNEIVTIGGVRSIAECVILTNKNLPARTRIKAINEMLQAGSHITNRSGYNELHAFVQDDDVWKAVLNKFGFNPTKGQCLVLGVD